MKHILNLMVIIAGVSLLGCTTAPEGSKIRSEVAAWAEDIAVLTLIAKPEYRPAIEMAIHALDGAEQSGGIDLNAITSALSHASALQSTDSKLAIFGGRLIVRRALGNIQLDTPDSINQAGLGLKDGLKSALSVTS